MNFLNRGIPPPRLHLFWPNGDVHLDGLVAMLRYVDTIGASDESNVSVYRLKRKPDFNPDTEFPGERDYQLVQESIRVSSLRKLEGAGYY